jgi:carboxypeptidase family protein
MVRDGDKIRVMRALSLHLNLLAGAVLALISAPAVGLNGEVAFAGTITDRFQTPVPTGVATLSSIDRVLQTHVTPDGQFRFDNVPRGVYDLDIKAYGFARQRVSVDLSGAEAPPLAIVLQGPSVPDLEECGPQDSTIYSSFDSKRPQLAGIVRSYDKRKPLRHAEVTLTSVNDPRITSHTRSDDHGRFHFESLAAGRYNLRISLDGYLLRETEQLLVPRENNVTVDVSMDRDDKKLIVCQ